MRFNQQEKYEIIKLVEGSEIGVSRTLKEIGVAKSTFYNWYAKYERLGFDGLTTGSKVANRFWNRIPDKIRGQVADMALDYPEESARSLACKMIDENRYFISESSVYRILHEYGLIPDPAFSIISASDEFKDKTIRVHEMWQTDFTYLKVAGWGWYYLSTVLDDYSRYIVYWELCSTMSGMDAQRSIEAALNKTGLPIDQRSKLLSDNGPCYKSKELKTFIQTNGIIHIHGKPFHPQTQGKIERYHLLMKNIIKLDNYYSPDELKKRLAEFVKYYNNRRYHESLNNLAPADVYFGQDHKILTRRHNIKLKNMKNRRNLFNLEQTKIVS